MGVEGLANKEKGRKAYDEYRRSLVGIYSPHNSATTIQLGRKFRE